MQECNPVKFPMDPKLMITKDEGRIAVNSTEYKSLVGGLRCLVHTRPDIAFPVGMVSRFMDRPTVMHLTVVKRILRYIKGTTSFGLIYSQESRNNLLTGYSDSDLARHVDDRKSTGGMRGENIIKHIRTDEQHADSLMKALPIAKFERMRRLLGFKDLSKMV
ncbi:hypothetical protein AgCh_022973 [Apium graveolens]